MVLEKYRQFVQPRHLRVHVISQKPDVVQPLAPFRNVLGERRTFFSRLNQLEVAVPDRQQRCLHPSRRHLALLHYRKAERIAVEGVRLRHVADSDTDVVHVSNHAPILAARLPLVSR